MRRVNTNFHLASLWPPETTSSQTVTIAAIESVTSITNVESVVSLPPATAPGASPRVVVERVAANVLGGNLSVADMLIWPVPDQLEVPVDVSRIDLAQILELAGGEDIGGEGSLSGRIPLILAQGTPGIRDGRLASDGGGALRFRSEQVSELIGQGGNEQVDLVVQALQDFRYDTLSMTVDKEIAGDGVIKIHLLGHNPVVLDGHPLEFNVNVSINLDEILAAVLEAYAGSTDAMTRAFGLLRGAPK